MNPDHANLQAQFDLLRRQFDCLESAAATRRRWTIPAIAALLCAGWLMGRGAVGAGRAVAQEDKPAVEITCKALKVVDDKGMVRIHLTHDKFGGVIRLNDAAGKTIVAIEGDDEGGFMRVNGHDGIERAFLGVTDTKNGGLLALADDKGVNRISMGLNKEHVGGLSFRNAGGKSEVFLGASSKGWGGLLNLNGADGNSRVILDVTEEGRGALEILNNNKKAEVFLGTSGKGWGGMLNLNSAEGASAVILDVDDHAWGRINLRNGGGKMFLYAGADDDGGVVRAFGHDAKERAFFGVGDKQGGGLIYLLGTDNNKARLVLGVDGNGVGFAEGRDAAGVTRRSLR